MTGGHNTTAVASPAKTWYTAEGCTAFGLSTWILIQNPNSTAVTVNVLYMDNNGNTKEETYTIGAEKRFSLNVNSKMKDRTGISAKFKCIQGDGIIVERATYWPATNKTISDGTCSAGVAG
jgi:hypothetical protein